jgi:hypothetical protein
MHHASRFQQSSASPVAIFRGGGGGKPRPCEVVDSWYQLLTVLLHELFANMAPTCLFIPIITHELRVSMPAFRA